MDGDAIATDQCHQVRCNRSSRLLWGIPLHDGTMSVGAVLHRDVLKARRHMELKEILLEAIDLSPLIKDLVSPGELISEVRSETDYSYASDCFCGPGFFMIGDAAAFLDPLLSSVHLATFSAMLAAAGLNSYFHGEVSEVEMLDFFEKSCRQAYLRFLVFLSAFYDVGRGRDSYFWEAQQLTQEDVSGADLKRAFLKLVTGLKDLSDAQSDTHRFILTEMTKRIDENLSMGKDKTVLATMDGEAKEDAQENAGFFSSVEGLFSLNAVVRHQLGSGPRPSAGAPPAPRGTACRDQPGAGGGQLEFDRIVHRRESGAVQV